MSSYLHLFHTMLGKFRQRKVCNYYCFLVITTSFLLFILIGIFPPTFWYSGSSSSSSADHISKFLVDLPISTPPIQYLPKQQKVIIASYMRSGSSITGRLLEENPDTFYVFEPLLAAETMRKFYLTAVYMDKPVKIMRMNDDTMETILENFLNCNLRDINLSTLTQFHMDKSSSTENFYYCSHQTPAQEWEQKCFTPFLNNCLSQKYSVLKTIRVRVASLEKLLSSDPSIKLVHLIRDPRAITASKITSWANKPLDPGVIDVHIRKSTIICKRMLEDINASEILFQKFPNQVRVLVYELFAVSPVETTRKLYDFVGFNFTNKIVKFVLNVTSSGHEDLCAKCYNRANSYMTSLKWRQFLTFAQVHSFNQYCSELLNKVGYTIFRSPKDFLDFNQVSWQYLGQPEFII